MTGDSFFDSVRATGIVRPGNTPLVGVCAGLAKRWNVDPLLIRAAFVALAFIGGAGITLYAVGWLLLPDESERIHAQEPFYGKLSSSFIIAAILALVPLSSFGIGPISTGFVFGPIGFMISLIIIAIILITLHGKQNTMADHTPASTPPGEPDRTASFSIPPVHSPHTPENPEPGTGTPVGWPGPEGPVGRDNAAPAGARETGANQPPAAPHTPPVGSTASSQRPWQQSAAPAPDRSELYATVSDDLDWKDNRPSAGSRAVLLVIALLLVLAAGVAFMLDRGFADLTHTNLVLGAFAAASILLGATITAYGFFGRRGGGLSTLGIIIAAATFPVAALMSLPSAEHHILMGEKTWTPSSAEEAAGGYSMIMGSMSLDVTELEEAEINVSGRLGEVSIIVGDDQEVAVITDYVMSDVSGTSGESDTSGVSGDTLHLLGNIDTVDEADIVIHVDIIMSDLNIERQS